MNTKKYKGIVREIYEYEIPIEAEAGAEAISKLKEIYNHPTKGDGIFLADGNSFLRADFSLRR
ncbi:hypothetical protein [Hungatella effluvii]|uniref:hypothetical protein n=1 Tax=Hungatella effluvii TaxID=1096246 RepID=UPI002A7ED280|nr:hypothetical protein [Hungatella effluvii]